MSQSVAATSSPALHLDDLVEFYPTFARLCNGGQDWQIAIQGRVMRPRPDNLRRKLLLRVLARIIKASPEDVASPLFQERVEGFLMLTGPGRQVHVQLGSNVISIRKRSKRNGHFRGQIHVPRESIAAATADLKSNAWVSFQAATFDDQHAQTSFEGRVQLIASEGVSVISDIDDTIKFSNVQDRRSLMAHTFLLPFEAVPGMSALYRRWAARGAAFHYVSSSPWQLYEPLARFLDEVGFPPGTFHLRALRLRDPSVIQLFVGGKRTKKTAIRSLFRAFPRRRFVLIGDCGERDPEIYGWIARRHEQQIEQICVRRLPGQQIPAERFKLAFRQIPRRLWRVFSAPDELSDLVAGNGSDDAAQK